MLPESRPAADESFFLSYEHPRSFEADAWIAGGRKPLHPVCIMNAGYSSGWCEESFGVGLVSVELDCRALGHDNCRFVMAPPEKIEGIIRDIKGDKSDILTHSNIPKIPEFFQRKRLEEELQRERDFVSKIVSTARVLICVLDRKGNIVQFNPACEDTTGYEASELIGTPVWETLILPEEREGVEAVFENLTREKCSNSYENVWVAKDGSHRLISWSNAPMLDSEGSVEHVIATGTDITEKKELEHQLLQAQKLESIGRLAAGVAHEINTPAQFVGDNNRFLSEAMGDFTEILSAFNQLLESVKDGNADETMIASIEKRLEAADLEYLLEEVPQALEQCSDGMDRIVEIVGAMKAFSHSGGSEKSHANVNEIIMNAVTISRSEWKYVAGVETSLDPEMPLVLCLPGELGQVFLNMIVNAAHAIGDSRKDGEGKGHISISTGHSEGAVTIRIEDDGPGVPEQLRHLIFEPFFTTKEVGKGTGQGLAISRTVVVDKHGGSISLECPEQGGAVFTVVLPNETH